MPASHLQRGAGLTVSSSPLPHRSEPFSFGGMYPTLSMYGDHDITGAVTRMRRCRISDSHGGVGCASAGCCVTGEGGLEFFTRRRKVTTKWAVSRDALQDVAQFR